MNKQDAAKIAGVITHDQLSEMFEKAKKSEIDWQSTSIVNPSLTKGAVWNILYQAFSSGSKIPRGVTSMIREFGEFLPEELKPKRKPAPKPIKPYHEEPIFEVKP